MFNDLAQIAKAKGIHQRLALMAILSAKPVTTENDKRKPVKQIVAPNRKEADAD